MVELLSVNEVDIHKGHGLQVLKDTVTYEDYSTLIACKDFIDVLFHLFQRRCILDHRLSDSMDTMIAPSFLILADQSVQNNLSSLIDNRNLTRELRLLIKFSVNCEKFSDLSKDSFDFTHLRVENLFLKHWC